MEPAAVARMVLVRPLSASRLRRTNPQDHHSRLRILATVSLVFCAVLGWISWTSRVHDRLTIAAEERYVQFAGQPSQAPPLHLPPPAVELSSLRCEGTSGLGHARSELDGDVVIAGWAPDGSGLTSTTPQQCCFECERTRGCNVWVHCSSGECAGQCWLKHQRDPRNPAARGKGPGNPWTSGTLLRAFLDPSLPLPQADSSMATVVLSTSQGDIRLRLRPEWSESSVEYVRRVAVLGDDNCVQCQLYRCCPVPAVSSRSPPSRLSASAASSAPDASPVSPLLLSSLQGPRAVNAAGAPRGDTVYRNCMQIKLESSPAGTTSMRMNPPRQILSLNRLASIKGGAGLPAPGGLANCSPP